MSLHREKSGSGSRTPSRGAVLAVAGMILVAVIVPLVLVPIFSDDAAPPGDDGAASPKSAAAPAVDSFPAPPAPALTADPATPAPRAAEPVVQSTPEAALRRIEVVDAATELAIPGADVFHREFAAHFDPRDFAQWIADATPGGKTDEHGRVAIECAPASRILVLARAPGRAGGAVAPPPSSPDDVARVALHPDWDLVVEVVDAALAPAPRVMIARREQAGSGTNVFLTPTDDKGRVVYEHVGLRLATASPKPEIDVSVHLPLLDKKSLSRRIDPEAPPLEPIRFTLPPLGSLAVRVLDAKNEPVADGTQVDMTVIEPGESSDLSPFSRHDRIRDSRPTLDGAVRFEHVDLGVDLEVRVPAETTEPKAREVVAGPRAPGETVEATIVLGVDHPVLVFRAVDEAGAPLPDLELELQSTLRSMNISNVGSDSATTDENGVFEHALPTRHLEGDKRSLLVKARGGEIGTLVDLSRVFEPGPNDMGDLPLVTPPLLVGGRVVDEKGDPVEFANVEVELPVRDEATPDTVWYWREAPVSARSDREGRFAARAFVAERTVRASATLEARRSAPVECAFGVDDVTLVLSGVGLVQGSVKLDPGIPSEAIQAKLEPSGGGDSLARSDRDNLGAPIEPTGVFRFENRLPGTYRFTLQLRGLHDDEDGELVAFDGVEVAAGAETRDPRLQDIDLRARLGAIRLTLVPPAGYEGELKGNATFHASGEADGLRQWNWFQKSPVTLVTPSESIDVTLAVAGFRIALLENVRGDREVKLEPAIVVRLALPPSVEIPRPPVHVKAALVPEPGSATPDFSGNAFDDSREIRCLAPGVGRMKVQWILERRAGNSASASTLEVEPVQFVDVRDTAGEQRFVLDVTTEAIEKAMQRR